jgi:putative ABC transport system ATP-binding protein
MKTKEEKKNNEYILEVEDLHKTYHADSPKPIFALKGIDLKIEKGQFVALMGRSGSGKSTFLHQVALLDTPTKGKIKIDGNIVSEMSDEEKSEFRLNYIGYIFQDYALLPELTLYENVALPMIVQGRDKEKYDKDVLEVIEKVGLKG